MRLEKVLVGSIVVGLLAVLWVMHGTVSGKAESDKALKIGVVDLEKVMEKYPTRQQLEKTWEVHKKRSEDELKAMAEELKGMADELESLDRRSKAAKAKRILFAEKQAKLSVRQAAAESELVERYKSAIEVVYNEVLHDVEDFRKAMGYDLIIENYTEPVKSSSLDQLQFQMMRKVVLARSDALDVTDEIVVFIKGAGSKTKGEK